MGFRQTPVPPWVSPDPPVSHLDPPIPLGSPMTPSGNLQGLSWRSNGLPGPPLDSTTRPGLPPDDTRLSENRVQKPPVGYRGTTVGGHGAP